MANYSEFPTEGACESDAELTLLDRLRSDFLLSPKSEALSSADAGTVAARGMPLLVQRRVCGPSRNRKR